jgi:hypothetical protein
MSAPTRTALASSPPAKAPTIAGPPSEASKVVERTREHRVRGRDAAADHLAVPMRVH